MAKYTYLPTYLPTDQKNSEYGHFSHSVYYTEILDFRSDAIKKTKSKNRIRAAE